MAFALPIKGCLNVSEYDSRLEMIRVHYGWDFTQLINHELIQRLPNPFHLCYHITELNDKKLDIAFYLIDYANPINLSVVQPSLGIISFSLDKQDSDCYINALRVFSKRNDEIDPRLTYDNVESSGNGLGSFLLSTCFVLCNGNGISRVRLDDMSDNARKEKNIYRKMGLEYEIKDSTEPEMIGHLQNMFSNVDEYTQGKFNETLHFFEELDKFLEDSDYEPSSSSSDSGSEIPKPDPKVYQVPHLPSGDIPYHSGLSYSEAEEPIQPQGNFGRDGRGRSLRQRASQFFRSGLNEIRGAIPGRRRRRGRRGGRKKIQNNSKKNSKKNLTKRTKRNAKRTKTKTKRNAKRTKRK